jgi:uncharacterized protein YndB with AHSA1/START domain
MTEELSVSDVIPAAIERVYEAFLSSDEHSAMTGARATASSEAGGVFTAWGGYISGTNLVLEPYERIVQTWRAEDFPPDAEDSHLEIVFASLEGGTEITFIHTNLPAGMGDGFTEGWQKFYLEPMRAYFGAQAKSAGNQAQARATASTVPPPPSTKKVPAIAVEASTKNVQATAPTRKAAPKKPAAPKKAAVPKKVGAKKAAPKKSAAKKAAPKKTAPKKASPKKATPKKSLKKGAPKKKAARATPKKASKSRAAPKAKASKKASAKKPVQKKSSRKKLAKKK